MLRTASCVLLAEIRIKTYLLPTETRPLYTQKQAETAKAVKEKGSGRNSLNLGFPQKK